MLQLSENDTDQLEEMNHEMNRNTNRQMIMNNHSKTSASVLVALGLV